MRDLLTRLTLTLLAVAFALSFASAEETKEKPKFEEIRITNSPVIDADPDFSPDMQKIVFTSVSNEEGRSNLHIVNADGKMKSILHNVAGETHAQPKFLPDGKKILFRFTRGTNKGFALIDSDGTGREDLPIIPGDVNSPALSPDGTKFAYIYTADRQELWIYDFEAKAAKKVEGVKGDCDQPIFSRDGKLIFYVEFDDNGSSIFSVKPDGSDRKVVVKSNPDAEGFDNTYPRPAEDGTIFYLSDETDGEFEIWSVKPEGGERKKVFEAKIPFLSFDVSPDAARIVFLGNVGIKKWELFLLDVASGEYVQMTDNSFEEKIPHFGPDGKWVLYVSDVVGNPEIYKILAVK